VQIAEPQRRRDITRIDFEGAREAGLRDVVLSKHQRGDTRTETEARVVRLKRSGFREGVQRVAETPALDGGCPFARERERVLRDAGVRCSRERGQGEDESGRRDRETRCQGNES
jgi:hypothetical protein